MKKLKNLLFTAAISVMPFANLISQEAAVSVNVEQEIKDMEQQLAKIYVTADTARANRIYAPEYIQTFGAPARTTNRAAVLVGLQFRPASGVSIESLSLDVASVQHYGNTAVARGTFKQKSRDKEGKNTDQEGLFTHVWVKGSGGWQLVSSHNSPK